MASEQSRADCEAICKLGLRSKILTHIRCHMDVRAALSSITTLGMVYILTTFRRTRGSLSRRASTECTSRQVHALSISLMSQLSDVVIGTSSYLREHSHGKDMTYIRDTAIEVIEFVKKKGIEIRFSTEDSFRSDLVDLLSIYSAVDKVGVNRVGIADTVGCASPRQVYDLVRTLRGVVGCDIETHFHNDSDCAVANAYCALEAGATHVDTSVLGIGVRPTPHPRLPPQLTPHPRNETASPPSAASWRA